MTQRKAGRESGEQLDHRYKQWPPSYRRPRVVTSYLTSRYCNNSSAPGVTEPPRLTPAPAISYRLSVEQPLPTFRPTNFPTTPAGVSPAL